MMRRRLAAAAVATLLVTAAAALAAACPDVGEAEPTPPLAARINKTVYFGAMPFSSTAPSRQSPFHDDSEDHSKALMDPPRTAIDDLHWLRDDTRSDASVLAHLADENAYANASTWGLRGLREALYDEMLGRIKETDRTASLVSGGFVYYARTEAGKGYTLYCRQRILVLAADGSVAAGSPPPDNGRVRWDDDELGPEEIYLDVNELAAAANSSYYAVSVVATSLDQEYVAYAADTVGAESYELRFRHIATGVERASDTVAAMRGAFAWGADATTVYYTTQDATNRPDKVWRRTFAPRPGGDPAAGDGAANDTLLWEDTDPGFWVTLSRTRSDRLLMFGSATSETAEWYVLDVAADAAAVAAGVPPPTPTLIEARGASLYAVEHLGGDTLVITTNAGGAENFKVVTAPLASPAAAAWVDVLPYNASVTVDRVTPFATFAVLSLRVGGYTRLVTLDAVDCGGGGSFFLNTSTAVVLPFAEAAITLNDVRGPYGSRAFTFNYASATTPTQTWGLHTGTGERSLLYEQTVPGYNASDYTSERWTATACDGTEVPMSAVYRTDTRVAGVPQAVHLHAYGSYGIALNPEFSSSRLALLDRGVIHVTAHVRGGGELGRTWYTAAKFANKTRTFTDFLDCAQSLVDARVTTPAQLSIEGSSAGGLLVGAALTMAPGLFTAALARVAFVDVLVTMADPSIPLTVIEWREWGNPNTPQGYADIAAYSPMENIRAGAAYPAVYLFAGLYDQRVGYWEPTKFAARLRAASSSGSPVLLEVQMDTGHGGASARYDGFWEAAAEAAWLLSRHGIVE